MEDVDPEGEWKITLDVFRDMGLAFAAAMVMIYIILVAQTGSFLLPIVVMMAIPLTVIGVIPGFWMLNTISGSVVGGYADPVYFKATAMIALAGMVTRDSIILVDFIELAVRHGRPQFDDSVVQLFRRLRKRFFIRAVSRRLGRSIAILAVEFWPAVFECWRRVSSRSTAGGWAESRGHSHQTRSLGRVLIVE